MGRLIVEQIVTADGFTADSDGGISFFADPDLFDVGVDDEQLEMLRGVDAIVLGAATYRDFAAYWPTASAADEPVAEPINRLPKHVISNTLDRAPWGDRELDIVRGDGVAAVRALLERYSGDVVTWGSLTLVDALFAGGVVDVLRLRIVPRLLGSGRGVFPAGLPVADLKLTGADAHSGGQVTLQYDVVR